MTSPTNKINILIVDDEKKACANLKNILIEYVDAEINVAGMANNTKDAEDLILQLSPDAVFLDIEMPNENAFHFLDRISPFTFEIVFVTAYDEYAVRAFKLNAVDYILKPISIYELKNSVQRLKDKLRYKKMMASPDNPYTKLSEQVRNNAKPTKITIRDANGVEVIDFSNIYYLEAHSSYSKIVFAKDNTPKEMIVSSPLSDYEEILPPELFYRVHRSYLVNCARFKKVLNNESYHVVLNGDFTLPVSRRRFTSFLEFLKKNDYF